MCLVNGNPKLQCELLGAASGQSCGNLQAEPGCSYREKVKNEVKKFIYIF